jgi:hypothetical protein
LVRRAAADAWRWGFPRYSNRKWGGWLRKQAFQQHSVAVSMVFQAGTHPAKEWAGV